MADDLNWPDLLKVFVSRTEFDDLKSAQSRIEGKLDSVLANRIPAWLFAILGPTAAVIVSHYLPHN